MTPPRTRDAAATKARILAVARTHFATHGYDQTTVRAVAADAEVAPNLITRYFDGKRGLFREATEIDLGVGATLPGPLDTMGHRIATRTVGRWEDAAGADPLLTMLRAAAADPELAASVGDYFRRQATEPLQAALSGPAAAERAAAVTSVITGVVVQRYVWRSGPLADASAGALRDWLGAVLQRVLTAPLPPLAAVEPAR